MVNDHFVDLFAAETSCLLAEISMVLGDRLPEIFHQRIRREVHQRLTVGLRRRDFHWITGTNNWPAVCAGASGIALMYLDPEGFEEHLPLLLDCMKNFLSGYPEDGTCMEGTAYWEFRIIAIPIFVITLLAITYPSSMDSRRQPEKSMGAVSSWKVRIGSGSAWKRPTVSRN